MKTIVALPSTSTGLLVEALKFRYDAYLEIMKSSIMQRIAILLIAGFIILEYLAATIGAIPTYFEATKVAEHAFLPFLWYLGIIFLPLVFYSIILRALGCDTPNLKILRLFTVSTIYMLIGTLLRFLVIIYLAIVSYDFAGSGELEAAYMVIQIIVIAMIAAQFIIYTQNTLKTSSGAALLYNILLLIAVFLTLGLYSSFLLVIAG